MATSAEWPTGFARQADADFKTFEKMEAMPVPSCHRLQFLQMACEKLVKAHLCKEGKDPSALQTSHAYVTKNLPIVLFHQTVYTNFSDAKARAVLSHAGHLAQEIEVLAPAVMRGGRRPDNCEYPWVDDTGTFHVPLDWTFHPSQLIDMPAGRTILKLIRGAIDRLL